MQPLASGRLDVSAIFSPCRTWRYTLTRNLMLKAESEEPCPSCGDRYFTCSDPALCLGEREPRTVVFIGLNPSTADERTDDPTIRRCVGYAKRWGYDRLVMLNLFGLRSTDPRLLYDYHNPVGPDNDDWIVVECASAALVVCAWGTHGELNGRGADVAECLRGINVPLHTLRLTKDGHPGHPLYLPSNLDPVPW